MSIATPPDRVAETAPRDQARLAGVWYLLNILTGALAGFLQMRGVATYSDIANLAATVCYLVVTLLFYRLFRPVDKPIALLAVVLSLVGCALGALGSLHLLTPTRATNLAFFGGYCVLTGYLIIRSSFLPHVFGVLLMIGGLGWMTLVLPPGWWRPVPYNAIAGILAETILTLWLLIRGVDSRRWYEQAGARPE